jgi:hypothetical protein
MQVNRKFLYWGTFLVAIGGVLVATNLGALDTATLTDALRLWPIAVVMIGVALVLRRNPQLSLSTGLLAAAVPGLVLGGAFAVAPRFTGDCGARAEPAITETQQGTFDLPASVSVYGGCGTITITTAPGNAWHLDAGNTADRTASVRSSPQSLSVQASGREDGLTFLNAGRDVWALTLPTSEIEQLAIGEDAGVGTVSLPGARIGQLRLTANLSKISVDATGAAVANLTGSVNLGLLAIRLPAGTDLAGSLRVDGGALQVCTPPGLGLRTTFSGSPREVRIADLEQKGSVYENAEYASAAHRADLDIRVALGAVEINPIGGCK